ncbi:MAG: ROK family protein [Pseudomonadota bacterium]|nr:ROK family protein [Pseudomonadota bacterium]
MGKAIGIDIGGTTIRVAAVDEMGCVHAHEEFATQAQYGFEAAVVKIARSISLVTVAADWRSGDVTTVGIGCTGPISRVAGTIHNPYTLPGWENENIVATLQEATSLKVILDNDCNAALMGEHRAGAGKGVDNLVMLSLGTGVGGSVMRNGHIYRGANGAHPELGHIPVDPAGPECYCGQTGCREVFASGPAITRAASIHGLSDSYVVFEEALRGNVAAEEILAGVGQAVGRAIGTLMHTFLPELVILGGGVMSRKDELLVNYVEDSFQELRLAPYAVRIALAELGTQAGVVGAAILALEDGYPD